MTAKPRRVGSAWCGSGSSSSPAPSATPSPLATPTPGDGIVAMALGEHGEIATSVNARQWITLRRTTPPGDPEQDGRIVLPPDAGADAGLAPVLGCPFDAPARECMADAYPVLVGESEWISGYIRHVAGSGFHFEFAALFGPTGRIVDLQKLGDEQWLTGVVPQPGGVFIGLDGKHEGDDTRHFRPVLWRAPDFAREDLPIRGFDEGPWPQQVNAEGRIVGSGIVPSRPVHWVPTGDGYELRVLPVLGGGLRGGALGIDADLIVGWSDGDDGERAVIWRGVGDLPAIDELLVVVGAAVCARALAISGARIVGECTSADGTSLAALWTQRADDASWSVTRVLSPLPGDAIARVVALSGDLAVGTSADATGLPRPVAWRLPSLAGER